MRRTAPQQREETMTRIHESIDALAALPRLPDYAILTKQQTCAVTNLSADTLDRLHKSNEGPPRVQLSPRRVGYPAGGLRKWLEERSS
jgi:predicted DNA-binding transcriptional regulator AlpA